MIKISEHLNIEEDESFLDKSAEDMWYYLNYLEDKQTLKEKSLINKLEHILEYTEDPQYKIKYANNDSNCLMRHKSLYTYLKEDSYNALKNLIISRPNELISLKDEILGYINYEDIVVTNSSGSLSATEFSGYLQKNLFNYKNYRLTTQCVNHIKSIGFESAYCPYCNENRLLITKSFRSETDKQKAYLDLDHFYPKSRFPFFALSFFNLIPSCHSCNSTDKGAEIFTPDTHVHPYIESFNDRYKFSLVKDELEFIYLLDGDDNKKSIEHLNLKNRYESLTDEAIIIKKSFLKNRKYLVNNNEYRDTCIETMLEHIPKTKNDILNKSFGKMRRDIFLSFDEYSLLS